MMTEEQRNEVIHLLMENGFHDCRYYPARNYFCLIRKGGNARSLNLREERAYIGIFGAGYGIMRDWARREIQPSFERDGWRHYLQNNQPPAGGDAVWFNFLNDNLTHQGSWYSERQRVIGFARSLYEALLTRGIFSDNFNPNDYANNIPANNQQNVNNQQGVKAMSTENSLEKQVTELLKSNLQVVLTGAPGTGKTYTAKKVAFAITGDTEDTPKETSHITSVQFHPGYDYSDFVIGMKPILVSEDGKEVFKDENGQLYTTYNNDPNALKTPFSGATSVSYAWKDGVFKKFAAEAKKAYDAAADKAQAQKYVFLIDEINRADLSRVFGELFSLLEEDYRYPKNKNGIRLPNGENFVIPENLYIIGTMNDIDRSVESMDFALRRRFAWYEVSAESSAVILDDKGNKGKIAKDDVVKLKNAMQRLNDIIAPPSTGKDETAESGQGSDKKPDLRLGSAYQLGGAIFAKLEKYVKVVNDNPSVAEDDAFRSLWNNHVKNILSEYLRGRRDRDDLLKELEAEFTKAVSVQASEPESNSISSDGESQAQANLEQTPQA